MDGEFKVMSMKMDEKVTGLYPSQSATPDKILKKLGFRRGSKSKGTMFEHGQIFDPHTTEVKSLVKGSNLPTKDKVKSVAKESNHTLDKATTQGMMRKLLYER